MAKGTVLLAHPDDSADPEMFVKRRAAADACDQFDFEMPDITSERAASVDCCKPTTSASLLEYGPVRWQLGLALRGLDHHTVGRR
jgi:hypothetical protein